MHNHVGRRLFLLLSRILGMSDDALWEKIPGKGSILPYSSYCRFQVYHALREEDKSKVQNILPNHTDHGATTFLPSQPVSCLQILGKDQKWRWVPYRKGALVCNLGDVMEILSGGILKATRHRGELNQLVRRIVGLPLFCKPLTDPFPTFSVQAPCRPTRL